ncbi:hypothetical protein [Calothrix rhizosoleniae]|nr:hypothetical protein [Calothrix rhizosoleniae]
MTTSLQVMAGQGVYHSGIVIEPPESEKSKHNLYGLMPVQVSV